MQAISFQCTRAWVWHDHPVPSNKVNQVPQGRCILPTAQHLQATHTQRIVGALNVHVSRERMCQVRSSRADSGYVYTACHWREEREHDELTESQQRLDHFMGWLVANGVEGIGGPDSAVSLYEEDNGERGVIATKDIKEGQIILRIPLRLSITDHPGDEESNSLLYQDAPWSVRLACKLLREKSKGVASPWHPYLEVLPVKVPAPLETFTWEDMSQVEYQPTQAELHEAHWLITDSYKRATGCRQGLAAPEDISQMLSSLDDIGQDAASDALNGRADSGTAHAQALLQQSTRQDGEAGPDADVSEDVCVNGQDLRAVGGADEATFQWAMSVVHSRTFGNASPSGGVGVRMLVPLVDMINHAGDESASGLMGADPVCAMDNVRWDVVHDSGGLGWHMAVKATQNIAAGGALALSYGHRPSDDFFLHYGFVPSLCCPHEDAILFEDPEEAMEWHYQQYTAGRVDEDAASDAYTQAYELAMTEHKEAAMKLSLGTRQSDIPTNSQEDDVHTSSSEPPKGWKKLKAYAGGRVDGALVSCFQSLATAPQLHHTKDSVSDMGPSKLGQAPTINTCTQPDLVIARRAYQVLESMATPLLVDLALLALHARHHKDVAGVASAGKQLVHHMKQLSTLGQLRDSNNAQRALSSVVSDAFEGTVDVLPDLLWCPSQTIGSIADALRVVEQELQDRNVSGTLSVLSPLTPAQHLCVRFRACKKLVLFDVVFNAIAQHEER